MRVMSKRGMSGSVVNASEQNFSPLVTGYSLSGIILDVMAS